MSLLFSSKKKQEKRTSCMGLTAKLLTKNGKPKLKCYGNQTTVLIPFYFMIMFSRCLVFQISTAALNTMTLQKSDLCYFIYIYFLVYAFPRDAILISFICSLFLFLLLLLLFSVFRNTLSLFSIKLCIKLMLCSHTT